MMPLGLTDNQHDRYLERLFHSHDFDVQVDVLHLDESTRGQLTGEFIDGQVNIQGGDSMVRRTATFTLHDPDTALNLDAGSPYEGAVYFDRMVRVRHTVTVSGVGEVTATPFIGPITKISRTGSILTVECQDKTTLALEGRPPMTRKKGTGAVAAIREFLEATGETRFRFEVKDYHRRKRLPRDYSTGWTTEASPWVVADKIARGVLGCQLTYSCDGAVLLRPAPTDPVVTWHLEDTVGQVGIDYDASKVRNYVRVTGEIPSSTHKNAQGKKVTTKARKFTEAVVARSSHPMSPGNLGRNGKPRYLPLVVEDTSIRTHKDARARAQRELDAALPLEVGVTWNALPVFHLDYYDLIRLDTPDGTLRARLTDASIPLGLGGEASLGTVRRVSLPRRSGRRTA